MENANSRFGPLVQQMEEELLQKANKMYIPSKEVLSTFIQQVEKNVPDNQLPSCFYQCVGVEDNWTNYSLGDRVHFTENFYQKLKIFYTNFLKTQNQNGK